MASKRKSLVNDENEAPVTPKKIKGTNQKEISNNDVNFIEFSSDESLQNIKIASPMPKSSLLPLGSIQLNNQTKQSNLSIQSNQTNQTKQIEEKRRKSAEKTKPDEEPKEIFKSIVEYIKKAPKTSNYSVDGEANELPKDVNIEVKDFGRLNLPLEDPQASELIKVCKRAPYGKNEQTLIDPNVRDSYQLDPSNVTITNGDWDKKLQQLVNRVGKSLGCKGQIEVKRIQ